MLTTLSVDNSDLAACAVPGDNLYCEIQDAVNEAASRDTIKVAAGTYAPFEVDKDHLTIREATANSNPVIDATDSLFGITIDSNHVKVSGFHVRNATPEGGFVGVGIGVGGDNNAVSDNTVSGNTFGIAVSGDRNVLLGNTATENDLVGIFVGPDTDGNLPADNRLVGNTANNNGDFQSTGFCAIGIVDTDAVNSTYINNTTDNNCVGLLVQFGEGTTLTGNTSSGNDSDGFRFIFSVGLTVTGNTATNNGLLENNRDGFRLLGVFDSSFTGNSAQGNGRHGFSVDDDFDLGSSGNVFTGNHARDNGVYGFFVNPAAADNVFRGLACDDNGSGGSNLPDIC